MQFRCYLQFALAGILLCTCTEKLSATITIDRENFPWDEERKQKKELPLGGDPVIDKIQIDQMADGFESDVSHVNAVYHMVWNGKDYFISGLSYPSREQYKEISQAVKSKRKSRTLPNGGICSLFVYSSDLKRLAKHDIRITSERPIYCNFFRGLGRVKDQDSIVVALSYYHVGNSLAKKMEDIGDGWIYFTTLLRFKMIDGKVVVEQDDSCLGPQNRIEEISVARKLIAKCK